MIFKNKFKKQDADALKKEASREVKDSETLKNAQKDPQGTYNEAKDLAKKTVGKDGIGGDGSNLEAETNARGRASDGNVRTSRSGAGQKASDRRSKDAHMTTEGNEGAIHKESYSRGPRSANQEQEVRRGSSEMAGSVGGIGDPEDEFEMTNGRHSRSEYVPGSPYGSPASPRNDVPMAASSERSSRRDHPSRQEYSSRQDHPSRQEYSPREDYSSTAGRRSRSPKKASSGTRRVSSGGVNRNVVENRSAHEGGEGGVAGGGATSGAGGYGYDYPDYEDRSDWDRRHSKGGFSFPFFHHRHHKDPKEEAEEVGGATSAGAPGIVGSGMPTRAPVRANSKMYNDASPTAGKDSAAVAGADAAARRNASAKRNDDHAPYGNNDYGKRDGKTASDRGNIRDDNLRGSNAGSVARNAGEREGHGERTESQAVASARDSYRGGYEAGYLAAKRGEPLEPPNPYPSSSRNEPSGYSNVSGGGHKRADTKSRSKTNPFEKERSGSSKYGGTGAERYGAHEDGGRGGNLGGAEEYGYGNSPVDEFGDERFDYDVSSGGLYNKRGSYEGEGVGRRTSSGRESGAGRRMSPYEGEDSERQMSSGRDYGSYEGEGAGRRMSPYEGEGWGRQISSEGKYGRDDAGYAKSPGPAVGPGSDYYPESYGDYYSDFNSNTGGYTRNMVGRGQEGSEEGAYGGTKDAGGGTAAGTRSGPQGGGEAGGVAGSIAKAVDKAGGTQKISESVNKAADSKVGGMAKGKATGLAKDKLGHNKAGEVADKAKFIPGANDAAKKVQGVVGEGINSKLANAGASSAGAGNAGVAGTTGAAGIAGAAGTAEAIGAGGAGNNARTQRNADVGGRVGRKDISNAYVRGPQGYGYESTRDSGDGLSHDGTAYRYGHQDAARPGEVDRTSFYDDGSYNARREQVEPSSDHTHNYRRYGHAYLDEEMQGATPHCGGTHEAAHAVYAPSGGRSYDYPGQEPFSGGNYRDGRGIYDVRESNLGRPSGHAGAGETDSRLRRAPGGLNREGKERREEQLGISDGNQVSAAQEQHYYGGDGFSREASANSADYYDSSEALPGSRQQGTAATKKSLPLEDRTARSPSMNKSRNPEGGGPMSAPVRSGSMRDYGGSGERMTTQQDVSPGGNVNTEPVGRARSAPNFARATEAAGNAPSGQKPTAASTVQNSEGDAGSSGEGGKRFTDKGHMPSLIDPTVPTYGWGTTSGGETGDEHASKARGAGAERRGPGSSEQNSNVYRDSKKSSVRHIPNEDVERQNNYVTSQRNVRGRSESLISNEERGAGYGRNRYTNYGGHQGTGQRDIRQPPGYMDDSSKVPRSATEEANQGEDGGSEPGIFDRIRSAFTSSHSDTTTNA